MNTMDIAKKLADLCRQGKNEEAVNTLFSTQAVSVEAFAPPRGPARSQGSRGDSRQGQMVARQPRGALGVRDRTLAS
jgi:hypothetical protein